MGAPDFLAGAFLAGAFLAADLAADFAGVFAPVAFFAVALLGPCAAVFCAGLNGFCYAGAALAGARSAEGIAGLGAPNFRRTGISPQISSGW